MCVNIPIMFLYIISVFEVWMCCCFLFCTMMKKIELEIKERVALISCVGILGSLLAINRLGLFFSDNMLLFCILITCIYACALIRHDIVLVIEVVAMYYAVIALFDFFFSFLCISFLEQQYYHQVYHNSLSRWSIMIFVCSRIMIGVIIAAIQKKLNVNIILEYKNVLFVFCIVLFLVLKIYQKILYRLALGNSEIKWWSAAFSLLTIFIIIIFCIVLIFKYKMIQKDYDVLTIRNEMLVSQYQKMDEILEKNRCLTHDIRNQLLILQGLEQSGNLKGLHQYLIELSDRYIGTTEERWTENHILDLVIKQKKSEAEKENIVFEVSEISFLHMALTDGEIVSLFGNLLDNAIEACMLLEAERRFINLKIEQKGSLLFIKIQNSINKSPVIKKGRIQSTKGQGKAHGYGLKNVQDIIDKYEGVMSLTAENHIFQVDISFFSIDKEVSYDGK